jgi:hypothetical protein
MIANKLYKQQVALTFWDASTGGTFWGPA